ncbi:MAG TPA: HAD family hydrolase [Candidatus Woesearchaeota archaeon]|nr:HAD family hydrolase [Candidatus Woesearchaeota archaeon]
MRRNIILDFDGVIADSLEHSFMLTKKGLKKFNLEGIETLEEFRQLKQKSLNSLFRKHKPGLLQAIFMVNYAYSELRKDFSPPLRRGVKKFIDEEKSKGKRLFIISNNFRSVIRKYLKSKGILHYFSHISKASLLKDKVRKAEKIMKRFKFTPGQAVFITDTDEDVVEISSLKGIVVIGITGGFCNEDNLAESAPDYLVDSFAQISKIIDSL